MPLEVQCPHCQKRLRAPDNLAGKKTKCPQCRQALVLPAAEGSTGGPPASNTVSGNRAGAAARNVKSQTGQQSPKPASSTGTHAGSLKSPVAQWYMRTPDGQDFGPITQQDLDHWVGEGRLDADCMVLCDGWEQWKWASDVYPQLAATPSTPTADNGIPALDDSLASLLGPPSAGSLLDEEGPALTLQPSNQPPALPTAGGFASNAYAPSQSTSLGAAGSRVGRSFGGEKSWLAVEIGVGISNWAMLIGTGCLVGLTLSMLGLWTMRGSTSPSFTLLGLLSVLMGWSAIGLAAVGVVQLTGWVVCLRVPGKSGARSLIVGAIGCIGVALFIAMLLSLVQLGMLNQLLSPQSMLNVTKYAPLGLIVMLAAALGLYAGYLGQIAEYLGDNATPQQALYYAGMQVAHVIWTGVSLYAIDAQSQTMAIIEMLITLAFGYATFIWLALIERTVRYHLKSS